ncbi:MAG TPA: hypothetical protein PKC95_09830, partial [Thauera aminoaromatica]|nr:hypothetical protein [Thauera aminoaromatica]
SSRNGKNRTLSLGIDRHPKPAALGENKTVFFYSPAMHVRVVELMVAGVRRPRQECLADPGTIGTLSIGDIPIGTAEKRPLHAAQLWERWGSSAKRGLLPPLFDVQVLRITPRGLLLRGFQVSTKNGLGTAQHAQEWWAVPIAKLDTA